MDLKDFDYKYPKELVAQVPLRNRDDSRMLVLDRSCGRLKHSYIKELPLFINKDDILVVNNSRVFPARLIGEKMTGGRVEVLLLAPKDKEKRVWSCMTTKTARLKDGTVLRFKHNLKGRILERGIIEFDDPTKLAEVGLMPLPPYIKRNGDPKLDALDRKRYQTIYARKIGSSAAPTAGLHFTKRLLNSIKDRGARIVPITLHVGPDTFTPVREKEIERHKMHGEEYFVPAETAKAITRAKSNGGRVIAVGTTCVRALESFYLNHQTIEPSNHRTNLFIYPGYRFRVVDALLTNFHLPCSTLIMLVSAFAGRERILAAYEEAIRMKYRLFSYGDCMLIL